ncbi:MAG: AraC family transcriptional regulator [Kordiimonadaceae bacterium]|nr:AraC family transcriptional regulator [Kordiimonadaceae bacterium]MBO6567847.1 AraC family transcriptional regulator [Kordiimonadaceae bacterium]MBO6964423.1 AraC family transcriptional regulator [Kordiimonadaceae bacterium]
MGLLIQNLDYAVSFACLIFALHMLRVPAKHPLLSRLLGIAFLILAAQAALLYLITLFGRPSLPAMLLPAMPLLLGPVAYLFFKAAAVPRFKLQAIHSLYLIPAVFAVGLMAGGEFLTLVDYTVLLSQLGYAVALSFLARGNADGPAALGVYANSIKRWIWLASGYFLIMFVADLMIYMEIQAGTASDQAPTIMFTLLFKLILVAFMLLLALQNSRHFEWIYSFGAQTGPEKRMYVDDADLAQFQSITHALAQELGKPDFYEEEPPSLKEMAYRLSVPIRQLSLAVNHTYDESYSRYLNRQRIKRAKAYIKAHPEAAMIDVMYEAGFRTKSSFNKEFKALEGMSPSDYRSALSQSLSH